MKVSVRGPIVPSDWQDVYDYFGIEATSPRSVSRAISGAGSGEDLEVEINSGGGSVFAGSEIYAALKSYAGNVTVKILGVAASAASVIAMAGKRVVIAPTAQIMIHNVQGSLYGDYRDMQHESEVLENYNRSIANAYRLKTGLDESRLLEMMNRETWMTAQQAKESGFADEIMFDGGGILVANAGGGLLPLEVIQKVKNMLAENRNEASAEKERLALLKLRRNDSE